MVFSGPDSATVYSAGTTPHFVGQGTAAQNTGIDWIIGNYRGEVRRTNGTWLITRYQINADEYAHTTAEYPLGHSDGGGNISFPDSLPSVPTAVGR